MIDKLMAPPAEVMGRARVSEAGAELDRIDRKLREARAELMKAHAAVRVKDCPDNRTDLSIARGTVNLWLDKRLEATR